MPGEWAHRLRELGENTVAHNAVEKMRSRATASNPFSSTESSPATPAHSITPGHNPFGPAAAPYGGTHSPFSGAVPMPAMITGPQLPLTGDIPETAPVRPVAVKLASGALLAAAMLTLVIGGLGAYTIAELRTSVGRVLELDQSGMATLLASGYADDTQVVLMAVAVAIAAIVAVVYLFVAQAIWRGRGWPRNFSPFLAVLSIPAVFIGPLAVSIVVAGVIATAAVWMPGARAYSQQQAAFRVQARARR